MHLHKDEHTHIVYTHSLLVLYRCVNVFCTSYIIAGFLYVNPVPHILSTKLLYKLIIVGQLLIVWFYDCEQGFSSYIPNLINAFSVRRKATPLNIWVAVVYI
jgi:hypothetical protein